MGERSLFFRRLGVESNGCTWGQWVGDVIRWGQWMGGVQWLHRLTLQLHKGVVIRWVGSICGRSQWVRERSLYGMFSVESHGCTWGHQVGGVYEWAVLSCGRDLWVGAVNGWVESIL